MIAHWYAVKTRLNSDTRWMGPSLVTIYGDTLYWSGGPSRMSLPDPENIEILKDYGELDDVDEYELYDQFILEFSPVAQLATRGGWLAPDGKFYPCAYMEHLNLAQDLAFVHYQEQGDGAQRIEKEGWAKVYADGTCLLPSSYAYDETGKYTQAQIDTLGDLFVLATDQGSLEYAKGIQEELYNISDLDKY